MSQRISLINWLVLQDSPIEPHQIRINLNGSGIRPICLVPLIPPYAELPLSLMKRIFEGFVQRIRSRPSLWFIQEVKTTGRSDRPYLQCFKRREFAQSCRISSRCFAPPERGWCGPNSTRKRERNSGIVSTLSAHSKRFGTITAYSSPTMPLRGVRVVTVRSQRR